MAKTQRAVNVEATTFQASCPCGGAVLDRRTYSYQLDHDSIRGGLVCDTCEAPIRIRVKTARL